MKPERYRLMAAVIAAHPNSRVVGRTRLQKTIKLLQRLGLPTDYHYMIHFYGPYSEGLQSEISLLEQMGIITETANATQEGKPYFILTAKADVDLPDVGQFRDKINILAGADPTELELAATYDAFREMGMDHQSALEALRIKKGSKCAGGNEKNAITLLSQLGLPTQ